MGLFLDIKTILTAMKFWVNTQQINLRVGREEWGGGQLGWLENAVSNEPASGFLVDNFGEMTVSVAGRLAAQVDLTNSA